MRNRILKATWMLAVSLTALAAAQQPPARRGAGTWEWSAGGGVRIMDNALLGYLASGSATTRFTTDSNPGRIMPALTVRVGSNFSRHLGFSLGAEAASGSGVKYLTPFAALTYTVNLNARVSPFLTAGSQITRIEGSNGRVTHPTWGAHLGAGIRTMIGENLALRLEGRMATEHYAELAGAKAAYPSVVMLGVSYFVGGPRPAAVAPACPVCATEQVRVDTVWVTRVDSLRVTRVDTVRVREVVESPDQLVLRVQFITNATTLLRRSLPQLDTIARAIIATHGSIWEVQGHTDGVGSDARNMALSLGRAQAVVDYLVQRGVPSSSLTAVGYGETRPVVSNSTPEGRAQNRRVQIRRQPDR